MMKKTATSSDLADVQERRRWFDESRDSQHSHMHELALRGERSSAEAGAGAKPAASAAPLPESVHHRERVTMQRGRYTHLALMLGTAALTAWTANAALATAPSTDPTVAVTKTGLPAGWDAAPLGIFPDTINEKQSVSVDTNGVW